MDINVPFVKDYCMLCCRDQPNGPHVRPGPMGRVTSVGGLSYGSKPVFTRVSEKTSENSERLGRQSRLRIESGTSRLPAQTRSATGGAQKGGSFYLVKTA